MKTEIRITGDGSFTLFVPELDEHYHSTFGALTESQHVFIDAGLKPALQHFDEIHLLEIGFGTGLSAMLTILEKSDKPIHYTAIEPYPVDTETINLLADGLPGSSKELFLKLHNTSWEEEHRIIPNFYLTKIKSEIQNTALLPNYFNMVYFDAFGPEVQPEMWTEAIFSKISGSMVACGILTTYSAKGEVRRNLQKAGFEVERIPGPSRKRHMTRAFRV